MRFLTCTRHWNDRAFTNLQPRKYINIISPFHITFYIIPSLKNFCFDSQINYRASDKMLRIMRFLTCSSAIEILDLQPSKYINTTFPLYITFCILPFFKRLLFFQFFNKIQDLRRNFMYYETSKLYMSPFLPY